jgi:hypothetical protein
MVSRNAPILDSPIISTKNYSKMVSRNASILSFWKIPGAVYFL